MQPTNLLALKEWAVIVQALATGQQVLLLRKGGLYERHGQFSVEPNEFFLFPTYVHQMEQGVVHDAASARQAALAARPSDDQLALSYYATVENVQWLASRTQVSTLTGLHWWTEETIEKRFTYKSPGLYLFVLRVYQLPHTHVVPLLKRYASCRSWVELEQTLSTEGALPVMTDAAFAAQVQDIRHRLLG